MKMKSLRIKGTLYKVIIEPNYADKHGSGTDGHILLDDKKIIINANLDDKRKKEVLLHEVIHAIIHECSIYQSLLRGVEEILTDNIAMELARLFFTHKK
jgi:Zn-dependent peptidase ImmA (M78 family)